MRCGALCSIGTNFPTGPFLLMAIINAAIVLMLYSLFRRFPTDLYNPSDDEVLVVEEDESDIDEETKKLIAQWADEDDEDESLSERLTRSVSAVGKPVARYDEGSDDASRRGRALSAV